MRTPLLKLQDITKIYRKGPETIHALDHVSLNVDRGEFVSIVGPSGSGKSTLLNVLSMLIRPTSGDYFLQDTEVSNLDDDRASEIRNQKIGFIFQSFNLFPQLTTLENIEVPMVYAGTPPEERRPRAKELAEQVELGDRMHHRPPELSGGERQRVAIARALSNDPSVLLGDEPTGNLDKETEEAIVRILQQLNDRGITIIMVTHDLELAEITDRKISLRSGVIE